MTEPIFFKRGGTLALREIVSLTGAEPRKGADLDRCITGVAALDRATPSDLAFLDNARYADQAATSGAGACLTVERLMHRVPERISLLCVREPYRAFVEVARTLFPDALRPSSLFEAGGVAPGAFIHASARVEAGAAIDPGAVIGPRAEIGAGTVIAASAVIGPNVRVGRDCGIGANVTLTNALVGDRVIVHPGCAIGQDGFGYVMGPKGHRKVPQLGRVIIQDDVEIGANTTIDRGAIRDTIIGEGTKIDNLVQIGHNVTIGRHCIVVAHCGISGSTTLEDYVVLAGRVGLADNITIGEGAIIGAGSGVMSSIPAGEKWLGYPAMRSREFLRSMMALRQFSEGAIRGSTRAGASPEDAAGEAGGGKAPPPAGEGS